MRVEDLKARAADWFAALRDRLCAEFEAVEAELGGDAGAARFERTAWQRTDRGGEPGGGGVMSTMKGRVFEKIGVNISSVHGSFDPDFAKSIPGAETDPTFFATGISVVAHPASPRVPGAHMNTRYIVTAKDWFGGGADLNPPIPDAADTEKWHAAFKAACGRHPLADHDRYKAWCDDYFFIRHRGVARGQGGIFYDQLASGDGAADFAFTRDVGETFLGVYPRLVRRHMREAWGAEERERQLRYRGCYAEFNLLYDRGTLFGLRTGGNVDAILMSLPPLAAWD